MHPCSRSLQPPVQAGLYAVRPGLLQQRRNPRSIHHTLRERERRRTRETEELENRSSNWMKDLLRVPPVLYLIVYSDLFLRIREHEYRLAALGGDCHSGFLLFVSASLFLSVCLPLLSLLCAVVIHLPVSLCFSPYLTYSRIPPSLSALLLLLFCLLPFLSPCHGFRP